LIRTANKEKEAAMMRQLCLASAIALLPACEIEADPEDDFQPPYEMLEALQRDLGQTEEQIERRLVAEARAAQLEPLLRDRLGGAYGGAWMSDDGGALIVGITDEALAAEVRAAGAEPRLVGKSLAELEAELESAAGLPDPAAHSWYIDVANNRVVVDRDGDRPVPYYDLRGGDEIILGGTILCSVGFSVHGGYVTAGHCAGVGTQTAGSNWVAQGTVLGSQFPTADHAWVQTNGSWITLAAVGDHAGGEVAVHGSQDATIGSSICRSGRTTGWRCGVIQAKNVTVNYAAGPVYGMTQTSACAQGGDSGGSFISGNQAQGITSGGSGNCTSGGTTFFQPIGPALAAYGLSLKTAGGGTRPIVSNYNNKCIDVPWSNFVDGAQLQMWDCNGSAAQRWTFVDGTIRAGGKCMDVAWGSTANGAAIQLANCSGNLAQRFVLTAAGDLVSVLANKCVDIKDWSSASGARLQIWSCAGTANQKWH
jgi:streptogrisin C